MRSGHRWEQMSTPPRDSPTRKSNQEYTRSHRRASLLLVSTAFCRRVAKRGRRSEPFIRIWGCSTIRPKAKEEYPCAGPCFERCFVCHSRTGLLNSKFGPHFLSERLKSKKLLAILLCMIFPISAFAGDNGYKIAYDGGSIPGVKAGTNVKLYIEGNSIRIVSDKTDIAVIPASAVTEISYGQDVHRRVGAAIGIGVFTLGLGARWRYPNRRSILSALPGTTAARRAVSRSKPTKTITAAIGRARRHHWQKIRRLRRHEREELTPGMKRGYQEDTTR